MRDSLLRSPRLPTILVLAVGVPSYGALLVSVLMANGISLPGGGVLGGDFIAFWTAARAVWGGGYPGIYDPAAFEAAVASTGAALGAGTERFGLTWQYPPHAMLAAAPLGLLPYGLAYAAFAGGGLAAFAFALRGAGGVRVGTMLLVLASPALFQTVVCGQLGAWVGALMLGALLLPDRRPVLAGVCAGLLTIKPQLGVLIPIVYLAGGHRAAFAAAAGTALGLAGLSLAVFGAPAWTAFADQVLGVAEGVGAAAYPLAKMPTVFAALRTLGAPASLAAGLQGAAALAAVVACWRLWRQGSEGREGRTLREKAAITAGLAFLCTPYAYYYDAPVLALTFLIAARGTDARAPVRLAALALCFGAPLFMVGPASPVGAQLGLGAVLLLTALAARSDLLRTPFRTPGRPGAPASA